LTLDNLIAGMTLTLHKSQGGYTILVSSIDELAVNSCPLFFLQRQIAKLARGLFCRWSLFRNNNMAINLQRFISSIGRKHFPCDC